MNLFMNPVLLIFNKKSIWKKNEHHTIQESIIFEKLSPIFRAIFWPILHRDKYFVSDYEFLDQFFS